MVVADPIDPMSIDACPFCGQTDKDERMTARHHHTDQQFYSWQVICSCGARGPMEDTEAECVDGWNKLKGVGKKGERKKATVSPR